MTTGVYDGSLWAKGQGTFLGRSPVYCSKQTDKTTLTPSHSFLWASWKQLSQTHTFIECERKLEYHGKPKQAMALVLNRKSGFWSITRPMGTKQQQSLKIYVHIILSVFQIIT